LSDIATARGPKLIKHSQLSLEAPLVSATLMHSIPWESLQARGSISFFFCSGVFELSCIPAIVRQSKQSLAPYNFSPSQGITGVVSVCNNQLLLLTLDHTYIYS